MKNCDLILGRILPYLADIHVAVVVPCYKVEESITECVRTIPSYVQSIILVDDASPGNTPALVDKLAQDYPDRVFACHHQVNKGVGGATMTGYDVALQRNADIIVKMDGDGQMDPEYLPLLLEPLIWGTADFCKGNRFASSDILTAMPIIRLIGNAGLSFLNRLASGYWKTLDPTNGYFAIRAEVAMQLRKSKISTRYFFESSQLIELGILRAVVRDIPMRTIYGNETSHLSVMKTLFDFPPKLLAGCLKRIWYTKILFDTSPDFLMGSIGALMLLFGIIWGIVKYIQFSVLGIPATSGTVMIAALPSILGFQMCLSAILIDFLSVPSIPLSRSLVK